MVEVKVTQAIPRESFGAAMAYLARALVTSVNDLAIYSTFRDTLSYLISTLSSMLVLTSGTLTILTCNPGAWKKGCFRNTYPSFIMTITHQELISILF